VSASTAYRSIGLDLSGSRNQKTCVAVLDFYPKGNRLILSELKTDLGPKGEKTGDDSLVGCLEDLNDPKFKITGVATTAPISLPPFFLEKKTCAEQIRWVDSLLPKTERLQKPFIPYLQRPLEFWLRYMSKERFANVGDAFGSNWAPLTARLQFLKTQLAVDFNEIFFRGALLRILPSIGLKKELVDDYNDLEKGLKTRDLIIRKLCDTLTQLFIYDGDIDRLILDLPCFHAFIAVLCQHLSLLELCDERPRDLPDSATWVLIPQRNLRWSDAVNAP
jgi:hypothetical protein